jgi:hypothetical protein
VPEATTRPTLKWLGVPLGGSFPEAIYAVDVDGYEVIGMTSGHGGEVWLLMKLRPVVNVTLWPVAAGLQPFHAFLRP